MRRLFALLLLAALPACAQTWVHSTKADFGTATSSTTPAITITKGDFLVSATQVNAQDEKDTMTDSLGNVWASAVVALGSVQECRIWFATARSSGSDQFTINNPSSVAMGIAVSDFTFANGTLDQHAGQNATGNTSPSITTMAAATELLIGFWSSNATAGVTISSPFNDRENLEGSLMVFGAFGDRNVTAKGTYNFGLSGSASGVTVIASFYSSGSSGGVGGALELTLTGSN